MSRSDIERADAGPASPLRLLFVIDSLGSGGAQRQMVTLALELTRRGHRPVFFTYHPGYTHFAPELAAAGIEVRSVSKSRRFSAAPVRALRRILREDRFDVVLAFLATPGVYAELATRYPGAPPLVVSERSSFGAGGPGRGTRLRIQLHRLADAVVVNSHHHRRLLLREFPWMQRSLHTIWNGVDAQRFVTSPGIDQPDALIAVGTVRRSKNARSLARALILLAERGTPVPRIRWAGKVERTEDSVGERDAVDRILADAGLTERWEWLGERTDIPTLLGQHAALIHPSVLEGLPNAICEALAAGIPVLASDYGDHRMLVQEGVTGMLFDPHSVPSIAHAVARFVATPADARTAMGAAARRFAADELSMDRMCDEYESLFASLAGTASKAPPPALTFVP